MGCRREGWAVTPTFWMLCELVTRACSLSEILEGVFAVACTPYTLNMALDRCY